MSNCIPSQVGLRAINLIRKVFFAFTFTCCVCFGLQGQEQNAAKPDRTTIALELKNRRVLSLPITDKRHIIAHNMCTILGKGSADLAFMKRDHYDRSGPTKSLGGYIQFLPYIDYREGSPAGVKSQEEVAEIEIKAAIACGLTGFQFYYPFGDDGLIDGYCNRIKLLINAAKKLKADFKFTLCFANANHKLSEKEKIGRWANRTSQLIKNTPAEYWLKSPDGRHVFFTWMADGLADEIDGSWSVMKDASKIKYAALAYENLSKAIGVKAAWVYFFLKLTDKDDPEYEEEMLSYFPAVWGWCQLDYRYHKGNIYDKFAKLASERNRTYTQTATIDFYSSKSYDRTKTWDLIFKTKRALDLGIENQFKHYMELELTKSFRQSLERGIKRESGIINIVTWNDFAEGHHLAPEANHNFAFAMILNYYKHLWANPDYKPEKEKAAVFFKKYRSDTKPQFSFELHNEGMLPQTASDYIEVVTILKESATVWINNKFAGNVKAGIDSARIPTEPGAVNFVVKRGDKEVLTLTATESITDKPYRTDRLTYGYSTEEEAYVSRIFGKDRRTIIPSREY
ncbi:MAG: hypothetical protein JXR97_07720 [Planctomycetes bacterium]|nr:hypothetical protein [Planctomycetota bacterium]